MSFLTEFIQKYNDKKVDFDRHYGHQCMDLANQYRLQLTGLNPNSGVNLDLAYQIFEQPIGFMNTATKYEKIANTVDNCPIPGDIIVWGKGINVFYGHVAIVTQANSSNFEVLEQNTGSGDGEGDDDRTRINKYADYTHVAGWLRITDPNPNQEEIQPNKKDKAIKLISSQDILNEVDRERLINAVAGEDYEYLVGDNVNYRIELAKLREQNSGLAKQNTDNSSDRLRLLDEKAKAEDLARQKTTIIHELETKLNNELARVEELKAIRESHATKIDSLTTIVSDKQKIVEKQGEILNSQPKVWSWTTLITGQLSNANLIALLAGVGTYITYSISFLQSPEVTVFVGNNTKLVAFITGLIVVLARLKPVFEAIANFILSKIKQSK